MPHSIYSIPSSSPGYGPPDSRCLPCSCVSGKTLFDPSNSGVKLVSDVKYLSLSHASRQISILCTATPSNHRRNSDYPRQKRHGYSHNGKRHSEEKDGFEDLEESETFSSKNGPLLSLSGNQKFQATATPGHKEKEIVELFRKVQAQLRERAAMKEEKKVEDPKVKGKENGTVDSLLKLLRKHSVQQGKKNNNSATKKEFALDEPESVGPLTQERDMNAVDYTRSIKKRDIQHSPIPTPYSRRLKSNFQKRSPVPEIKFQPVYSQNAVNHVSQDNMDDTSKGLETDSESYLEPTFNEENVFVEMMEDETSEIFESEHDDDIVVGERIEAVTSSLSKMKLIELRALAKSRGIKGFSKLRKTELVELLSEDSTQ